MTKAMTPTSTPASAHMVADAAVTSAIVARQLMSITRRGCGTWRNVGDGRG